MSLTAQAHHRTVRNAILIRPIMVIGREVLEQKGMSSLLSKDQPALFLGIADFLDHSGAPFPFGGIDLFQLSQHKSYIVYPGMIQGKVWVVLVRTELFEERELSKWKLRITDDNNDELGKANIEVLSLTDTGESPPKRDAKEAEIAVFQDSRFTMIHFTIDGVVNHPGQYTFYFDYDGEVVPIGSVHFHYRKAPSLTPDQIKAIESNPKAIKTIRMEMGCKFCPTKLKAYTGLNRSPELEKEE